MTESVETVCREAQAFIDRHREIDCDALGSAGLVWGLLRAVYECPQPGCEGVFRTPLRDDPNAITCPSCQGVWTWSGGHGG